MASCEESHHFGGVLREIKAHHLFVELLSLGRWHTDRVDAVRHEHAVHHEARGALVAVEKKLLQGTEQEEGRGSLEWLARVQRGRACTEHPIQFRRFGQRRQWGIASMLTQAHI